MEKKKPIKTPVIFNCGGSEICGFVHEALFTFHEQGPKWCPVTFNCYEQFPVYEI